MDTKFIPVNKNATKEARELLDYLYSIRGKGIITGQHTLSMEQEELQKIEKVTGKLPALCGFELLSYSPNIDFANMDEEAIAEVKKNRGTMCRAYEWAERGGIVTLTWHWYSPLGGKNKSFYAEFTDFDASKVLVEGTPEREAFFSDMDEIAKLLQGFKDKNIPILWRPFHEANGDWFWWGRQGIEVAKELYRLMFKYYTEEKHLDNLIWVWNATTADAYVGDDYCDVTSGDWYDPEPGYKHTALEEQYKELSTSTKVRPYAIGENGALPDISAMEAAGTDWLWFMTWGGTFVLEEEYTTSEYLREQYNHPYAITLDKLPKLF